MIPFISILGPPGSGKGTQATLLSNHFNIPHVSTGDLIRSEIQNDTKLGRLVCPYIERGDLVPDDIVIDLFSNIVSSKRFDDGFISDGYPRTVFQAKSLTKSIQSNNSIKFYSLLLEVSLDHLLDRILGRLTCINCKRIYHKKIST